VLPHDDAYAWACRRRISVNRATGVIEVRDVAAIEERLPQLTENATESTSRLLDGVGDADLVRLGIDEQVLPFARVLTELDQLESARGILPEPQYDVLVGLAIGMTPEQVWEEMAGAGVVAADYDTSDVTAAVARSPQRVVLVSGPDELMEVFGYPFALWRIYLHPTQHRMAHGAFSGSARVTGGPGTGKTVVALHRAQHLAESSPGDRSVLVTTFTKTLAGSLEDSLAHHRRRSAGPQPVAMETAAGRRPVGPRRPLPRRRHPPAHLRPPRLSEADRDRHRGPVRALEDQLSKDRGDPGLESGTAARRAHR
jgi:hypothetical protein